jgi:hypothetical protein
VRRFGVGFAVVAIVVLSVAASVSAGPLSATTTTAGPQASAKADALRCAALRKRLAVAKRRGQRARVRVLTRSLRRCLRNRQPQPQPQPPPPPPPLHSPGQSEIFAANCKFGWSPLAAYLRVSTRPPRVTGARSRPGAEWVRYGAWLTDSAGTRSLFTSWSGWLAAADGAWATWTGETSIDANWRGNYNMEFLIEWWDESRRIAWQVRRITNYYYFDEHGTAWGGPFPSCMRQPV